jgi:hypothetical protein
VSWHNQDEAALKLHNSEVFSVMRGIMQRVRTLNPDKDKAKGVEEPDIPGEDRGDKKVLSSGAAARAGVGKKLTKALLAMWNAVSSDGGGGEYGSGNESSGETCIDPALRGFAQVAIVDRIARVVGDAKCTVDCFCAVMSCNVSFTLWFYRFLHNLCPLQRGCHTRLKVLCMRNMYQTKTLTATRTPSRRS